LIWTDGFPIVREFIHAAGTLSLSILLSLLTVTVLWSLYFLTDIANQTNA
jgi:hypothetical protein